MKSHWVWWYWMKHQGIQWYTDCIEWIIRESIGVLMLLNETSGNPIIYQGIHCCIDVIKWNIWELIYWYTQSNTDYIEWNIRESYHILMILIEITVNPIINWLYWMKHSMLLKRRRCILSKQRESWGRNRNKGWVLNTLSFKMCVPAGGVLMLWGTDY